MKPKPQHYCNHGEQCPLLRQFFRTFRNRVWVWDNGGETIDRYTVAIRRTERHAAVWDIYGMSADAQSLQGLNQFSTTIKDRSRFRFSEVKRGKRVGVNDLPCEVLRAISDRLA